MLQTMNRTGFIGGSDARRILSGDWLPLYEEKVGIRQPDDLSSNFRVQLGRWTEAFHREWLVEQHGMELQDSVGQEIHPDHDWMRATLDSWWPARMTFVELKHTNERATARSMAEDYLPQIAHYCAVCTVSHGYLSFIAGNNEPVVTRVDPPSGYIDELIQLEEAFWWHVENKIAPDIAPSATIDRLNDMAKDVKVDGLRFVDMTGNNQWAFHSGTVITNAEAARAYEAAKEALKDMVEKDVGEASGHGVTIKRDKRGSLRFTIKGE